MSKDLQQTHYPKVCDEGRGWRREREMNATRAVFDSWNYFFIRNSQPAKDNFPKKNMTCSCKLFCSFITLDFSWCSHTNLGHGRPRLRAWSARISLPSSRRGEPDRRHCKNCSLSLRMIVVEPCSIISCDESFQRAVTRSPRILQNQLGGAHSTSFLFGTQTFRTRLGPTDSVYRNAHDL